MAKQQAEKTAPGGTGAAGDGAGTGKTGHHAQYSTETPNAANFLSDAHRAMLEVESGISPEVIAARGYRTITDPDERHRRCTSPA
jgi:hypothetical protein